MSTGFTPYRFRPSSFRGTASVSAIALAGFLLAACGGPSAEEHAAKAEEAIEKERYNDAVVHLRNAIQEDRQNAELRFALGRVALQLNDASTATKELERAGRLGLDDPDFDIELARAWLMAGEPAKALEATGEEPQSAMLSALRGRALLTLDELTAAEAELQRSLEMEETAAAQVTLALLAQTRQDTEAARRHAEAALALKPEDQEAAHVKAESLHTAGDSEAALAVLDEADTLNRGRDLSNLALRSSILLDTGDLDGAESALSGLQKHARQAPVTQYLEARLALAREDFEGAKSAAESLLGQTPDHTGGLYVAAIVNAQLGNTNSARQQVSRLATLMPGNETVQQLRGQIIGRHDGSRQLASLEEPDGSLNLEDGADEGEAGERPDMPELDEASQALVESAREALIALREERFEDALNQADALSEDFPDNAAGPNLAGLAHRALGQSEQAIEAFREAVEREPANTSAVGNLAATHRAADDTESAIAVLDAAIEESPEEARFLLLRGRLALEQGDVEGSEAFLMRAAEQDGPESLRASIALARLYLATDRPGEVLEVANPLLDEHPQERNLLEAAAQAYTALGESGTAGAHFGRLADVTGDIETRVRAAQSYINAGESEPAVEQLRTLLDDQPEHVSARHLLAQELLRMGEYEAAKEEIDRVAEQAPDAAQTSSLLARYHFAEEEFDEAIAHFRDTLERNPTTAMATDLARAQWLAGRQEDARETLEDWLAEYEDDDQARMALADYLMELEAYEPARAHYETLLERHEGQPVIHNNLANALLRLDATEEAATHAERAIEAAPDTPAIRDTLGEVRLAQGRADEAAEHFARAASEEPGNAVYRLNHARALAETGEAAQAKDLLDSIIAEAGETEIAERARELRERL